MGFPWDFRANWFYTRSVFQAVRKLLLLVVVGAVALGAYNYSNGRDLVSLPVSAGSIKDSLRDTVRDTVRDGVKSAARETRDEVKERAVVAKAHAKETARAAVGVEIRFYLPVFPVPLRLIFGTPVRDYPGDRYGTFTFSIGKSF